MKHFNSYHGMVLLAMAGGFGWLFWHAHLHWGGESYYNYGWAIPFMAVFLLYRRIQAPDYTFSEKGPQRWKGALFLAALVVTGIGFFSVRLFNEANPFWRVPLWALGCGLVGLFWLGLYLLGGLRSLRHFYFPILFCLLALPWPWRLEQALIQSLTGWVTDLTVGCLNLMGYPAMALGNTIQIGEVRVGVDEACSGIRSLQSLVMISLFLGEYFFFPIWKRLLLIFGSVGLVLFFNGIRAVTLAYVTLEGDAEAFEFWHDALGHVTFIASCVLLFFLGDRLEARTGDPPSREATARQGPAMRGDAGAGGSQGTGIVLARVSPGRAWGLVGAIVGVFLIAEIAVQGYYAIRESRNPELPNLVIEWPESGSPSFELEPIPENIEEVLQYDFGTRATARWQNGLRASITYYGYTGEDRMASVSSFGHSPTICMTAVGYRLDSKKDPLYVELYDEKWKINHYEFVLERGSFDYPVQVFWLVWEPQQMGVDAEELGALTWQTQWNLVKNGRRNFGRQVLLAYFQGDHSPGLMRRRIEDLLEKIVVD